MKTLTIKRILSVLSVLAVLGVTLVGFVGIVSACSRAGYMPFPDHLQEGQGEPPAEVTFPEAVTLELLEVSRDAELDSGNSCGATGAVAIGVSYDDVTDYGLVWKVVEGTSPQFFLLPDVIQPETLVYWLWGETKDVLKESYDFQITATWVDAWRREGNPSEPLLIHVPAGEVLPDSSCSYVGGSHRVPGSLVWAGLGVMVMVVRRKLF